MTSHRRTSSENGRRRVSISQIAHGTHIQRPELTLQEREAPPLAVDRVLPRRERDVPAAPAAPLPDREADQLQAGEDTVTEVQLGIGELSGRVRPAAA